MAVRKETARLQKFNVGESLRPFVVSSGKLWNEKVCFTVTEKQKEWKSFLIYGIIYGLNMLFGKSLINVDCHVNTYTCVTLKVKSKKQWNITCDQTKGRFLPFLQSTNAHRVSRGIALLFLRPSALDGGGGQPHTPAASTPGKEPVPIIQEAGWTPGPVWTGGKSRPHRDSIPDLSALSQSLYRLSYRAHDQPKGRLKYFCTYFCWLK